MAKHFTSLSRLGFVAVALLAGLALGAGRADAIKLNPDKAQDHRLKDAAGAGAPIDAEPGSQGSQTHEGAHGAGDHVDPTSHFNYTSFGYKGKDVYGGKFDTNENPDDEAMSPPFLALVFNFALLIGLLLWKVRPGARAFAQKRHDEIKNALDEAAKLRAEAQAKVDEYSAKVKQAEGEVEKLLADIRADALSEKQRIIAAAEAQAEQLKREAQERITAEIDRARRELERDVVAAAVAITERVLREKTTTADHSRLVDTFLSDVAKAPRASATEERS